MNNVVFQMITWQFFDVPKEILKGWKTFLLFNLNYFSVPNLIKTYLSPWRRHSSRYGNPFDFWENFEVLIFNLMSRIIGAFMRTFFIIFGMISELFILIIGLVVLITWLLSPVLLIIIFIFGISLLL